MANSSEEIKALQKRLEKAENGIKKLEESALVTARYLCEAVCVDLYRVAVLWLVGDEQDKFFETWNKKLEDVRKEIHNAKTVESALKVAGRFRKGIAEYIRAEKVKTAEQAMDIAHVFVKKYSSTALPMKAIKENDFWLVDMDVGAVGTKIAKIKIDARTGDISSYEVPENQAKGENKKG